MEATNLDTAVESLLAPAPQGAEDNLSEAVDALVEPDQDAEVEAVEDTDESYDEVEASDDLEEYDATEVDDEVDAVDEDDEEILYDVNVNGKQERRTLSQLKQGYAGQEYIQQKMRENADTAKQLETRVEQIQQYEAQLAQQQQQMLALQQQMQQGDFVPPTPPSDEMFQDDPVGYMQEKIEYDKAKEAYDARAAQLQQMQQQQQQREVQQNNAYIRQQMELLQQKIPEFADPQQAEKVRAELVQGGQDYYGVPAEVLGGLKEAVEIEILRDAIRYRKLQEGKAKTKAKVKKAPQMVKPGARKVQDGEAATRKKQRAQFSKSGKIEDALSYMIKD